ncbi:MAG: hypothetical protein NC039_04765 [Muribaculaceae bacterium]|nr:hypothetical protein [Muribaculaceae bacterium]
MEKFLRSLLLALFVLPLAVCMTSCGDDDKDDEPNNPDTPENGSTTVNRPQLLRVSGSEDLSFSYNSNGQLIRIVEDGYEEYPTIINYNPISLINDNSPINVTTNSQGYIATSFDTNDSDFETYTYDSRGQLIQFEETWAQYPNDYLRKKYSWENGVITKVDIEEYEEHDTYTYLDRETIDITYSESNPNQNLTYALDEILGIEPGAFSIDFIALTGLFGQIPSKLPSNIVSSYIEEDGDWHQYNYDIIYRMDNDGNPLREEIVENYYSSTGDKHTDNHYYNYTYNTTSRSYDAEEQTESKPLSLRHRRHESKHHSKKH